MCCAITCQMPSARKDLEIKTLLMDDQDHGFALQGDALTRGNHRCQQMSYAVQQIPKRRGAGV